MQATTAKRTQIESQLYIGKTPFSGNTPFSSQTGSKKVQNASFRDISVLALQNAPRLHANHTKARSNGVFPTAGERFEEEKGRSIKYK